MKHPEKDPGKSGHVNIVLVDDHDLTRAALKEMIEAQPGWNMLAEATTGAEALDVIEACEPDLVVMDIQMPEMNGLEATALLTERFPEIGVLIVSNFFDRRLAAAALDAGARGFICKQDAYDNLIPGIKAVAEGRNFLSDSILRQLR